MATAKSRSGRIGKETGSKAAVDSFMAQLEHPHKPAIEAIRQVVRGADPAIAEGIKWNAPSFRTTEYFATTHMRAKQSVGIILHLGAKVRDLPGVTIDDPEGLLNWLAKDRAMASFADATQVREQKTALEYIVRQWIRYV
jgi:hypothetical protein